MVTKKLTVKLTMADDKKKCTVRIRCNKVITPNELADVLHQYADLILNHSSTLDS